MDKKKFYLCTEKGQYANGFWLFDYRMGTLKWDTNTNKWFILAKRTCERKPRHLVNKAIRLYDLRPGDTYYFRMPHIFIISKKYSDTTAKVGVYFKGNEYCLNTGVYIHINTTNTQQYPISYTVPQDLSEFPAEYKTENDFAKAMYLIESSVHSIGGITFRKTESPFVNIEKGKIVCRYELPHIENLNFQAEPTSYNGYQDLFRTFGNFIAKVYYRGVKKSMQGMVAHPIIKFKQSQLNGSRAFVMCYKISRKRKSLFKYNPMESSRNRAKYYHTSAICSTYRIFYTYKGVSGMLGIQQV